MPAVRAAAARAASLLASKAELDEPQGAPTNEFFAVDNADRRTGGFYLLRVQRLKRIRRMQGCALWLPSSVSCWRTILRQFGCRQQLDWRLPLTDWRVVRMQTQTMSLSGCWPQVTVIRKS